MLFSCTIVLSMSPLPSPYPFTRSSVPLFTSLLLFFLFFLLSLHPLSSFFFPCPSLCVSSLLPIVFSFLFCPVTAFFSPFFASILLFSIFSFSYTFIFSLSVSFLILSFLEAHLCPRLHIICSYIITLKTIPQYCFPVYSIS